MDILHQKAEESTPSLPPDDASASDDGAQEAPSADAPTALGKPTAPEPGSSVHDSGTAEPNPKDLVGTPGKTPSPQPETQNYIDQKLSDLKAEIVAGKLKPHEVEAALKDLKNETGVTLKTLNASLRQIQIKPSLTTDEPYSDADIAAAESLLKQDNLFAEFHRDLRLSGYAADEILSATGLLLLGRTRLSTSSSLYAYGSPSSGKSVFLANVTSFYLADQTLNLTSITPRFLYRAGGSDGDALKGKLVEFGEMAPQRPGEDDQMQGAIRQFVSENKLTLGSVDDMHGQSNVANIHVANGPVTIAFTGTRSPSEWDDQIITRSYCLQFRHTHETIKDVLRQKATAGLISSNPMASAADELFAAQRKWRAAWAHLRKHDPGNPDHYFAVEIPFLEQLIFKKKRLSEPDMRAFEMLKNLIATSALLHQKTRTVKQQDGRNILVATLADYHYVKESFLQTVPRTNQALSNDLIEQFTENLLPWWQQEKNKGQRMSKAQIMAALNVSEPTARRWIDAWVKADLLELETGTSESSDRKKYYRLAADAESLIAETKERGNPDIGAPSENDAQLACMPLELPRQVDQNRPESAASMPSDLSELTRQLDDMPPTCRDQPEGDDTQASDQSRHPDDMSSQSRQVEHEQGSVSSTSTSAVLRESGRYAYADVGNGIQSSSDSEDEHPDQYVEEIT